MRLIARTSPQRSNRDGARTIREVQYLKDARSRGIKLSFERLVFAFRHSQAADPRAKIYAFHSFVHDSVSRAVLVDYSKTTVEIFSEFASRSFKINPHYDIFSINNVNIIEKQFRHSWAPQWDKPIYDDPLAPGVFLPAQTCLFSAGLGEYMPRGEIVEEAILATGVILDRVSSTSPIRRQCQLALQANDKALLRTILEDRQSDEQGIYRRVDWSVREKWTGLQMGIGDLVRENILQAQHQEREDDDVCWEDVTEDSNSSPRANRIICHTDNGLLGNVPRRTRRGDIIVVLFGVKVPHVLRPIGSNERRGPEEAVYYLIGEW